MTHVWYVFMCVSYGVADSSESLEAAPDGKHVLDGVGNGCKLEQHADPVTKRPFSVVAVLNL